MKLSIEPREVRVSRWRERARKLARKASTPRPRNLRPALDLGAITFFLFRGRAYGVPPLPWQQGQILLDLYLELKALGEEVAPDDLPDYWRIMRQIARVAWANTRPTNRWRRLLKFLRIARNPFNDASEREIAEVAVFFSGCRMKPTGSFRPIETSDRALLTT